MLHNFNKINFTSLKIQGGGHKYKCSVPDRKKSGNTPAWFLIISLYNLYIKLINAYNVSLHKLYI